MKKQYLFAAVAILFWSSTATVTKLLLNGGLDSFQLLMYSSLVAVLVLALYNLFMGKFKKLKNLKAKDYLIIILISSLGTFFYNVFFYKGTASLLASQAFIINYMWPIMSVVFACVVMREKLTVQKILAIIVSFLGVGIVVGKDLFSLASKTLIGAAFCLAGAVCYGLFTALDKKYAYEKSIVMMFGFLVAFVLSACMNIVNGKLFLPIFSETLAIGWNGVFVYAVAGTCWNIALSKGVTAKISNLAYITPFLSLVWTYLILGDSGIKSVNSLIGLCVIVAGIFVQMIDIKIFKCKEKN